MRIINPKQFLDVARATTRQHLQDFKHKRQVLDTFIKFFSSYGVVEFDQIETIYTKDSRRVITFYFGYGAHNHTVNMVCEVLTHEQTARYVKGYMRTQLRKRANIDKNC